MPTIHIPTPLRPFTGYRSELELAGADVGELLDNLVAALKDLQPHLYGKDGKLRTFVNVYVNDEDIRYLGRERTPLHPHDTVSIVPSVAGGAPDTALEEERAPL